MADLTDETPSALFQLVLITGLSGSGKSVALAVLEDSGYYCVDNLPAHFLPQMAEFLSAQGYRKAAISIDVRSSQSVSSLPNYLHAFLVAGLDVRLLFLESRTDVLVKRFSETRRKHPLSEGQRTVAECIELEREQLAEVVDDAHRIDTSDMLANQLRSWVKLVVGVEQNQMTLIFQSFGFKHGLPLDADLVFDARALPNPHYDPLLRPLTGKDAPVAEFLQQAPAVGSMLDDIQQLVAKWLPAYVEENRSYLTVAVGCTGGQHRSVYLVESLAAYFSQHQPVLVRHRELHDSRTL
ncbi:RNase adapter RapZ [Leeia oryzae]|uniref:RNase adapter RapZ n=1 Tax=Leeia oryzae TaxID=356662 RepID=UPI00037018B7|nr:RNase adapter RapZ [Leeia oryzae]